LRNNEGGEKGGPIKSREGKQELARGGLSRKNKKKKKSGIQGRRFTGSMGTLVAGGLPSPLFVKGGDSCGGFQSSNCYYLMKRGSKGGLLEILRGGFLPDTGVTSLQWLKRQGERFWLRGGEVTKIRSRVRWTQYWSKKQKV